VLAKRLLKMLDVDPDSRGNVRVDLARTILRWVQLGGNR
jgi:hypothetical protein